MKVMSFIVFMVLFIFTAVYFRVLSYWTPCILPIPYIYAVVSMIFIQPLITLGICIFSCIIKMDDPYGVRLEFMIDSCSISFLSVTAFFYLYYWNRELPTITNAIAMSMWGIRVAFSICILHLIPALNTFRHRRFFSAEDLTQMERWLENKDFRELFKVCHFACKTNMILGILSFRVCTRIHSLL